MNEIGDNSSPRSVNRIMRILKLVAASQEAGLRVVEVADKLALSYTTAHRILQSLLIEEAVEKTLDGKRYCVGPEISLLGLARTGHFPLRSLSIDSMQRIRSTFGETCYLTVRSQLDSVCIHREVGNHGRKVLSIDIGSRRPMGVVIGSIAYLASLPELEANDILNTNANRYPHYQLDLAEIQRRVRWARRNGYAYTRVGLRPDTRSVSVAIVSDASQPLASLSVVAVTDRMKVARRDEIAIALLHEAQTISERIGRKER